MDSAKKVRWIIPFKQFGMVRVNWPNNSHFIVKFIIKLAQLFSPYLEYKVKDFIYQMHKMISDFIKQIFDKTLKL